MAATLTSSASRSERPPRRKGFTMKDDRPIETGRAKGRPISIVGSIGGKEVAWDRADTHRLADRIAAGWRDSGLEVVVSEAGIGEQGATPEKKHHDLARVSEAGIGEQGATDA